jgi:hypothetical protein
MMSRQKIPCGPVKLCKYFESDGVRLAASAPILCNDLHLQCHSIAYAAKLRRQITARSEALRLREGRSISGAIINLIIQLIAGAIGGNAAGSALREYSLGGLGNTIAGAIGGAGGGQLLQVLIPALAGAAGGGLDLGSIVGQLVGGGVGGAILTIIAGLVKNMAVAK